MTAWTSPPVTMLAVPIVRSTKPQKIPACISAAREVPEHLRWASAYSTRPATRRGDVAERVVGDGRASARRPAGGGPSPGAKTTSGAPEQREDERVRRARAAKAGNISSRTSPSAGARGRTARRASRGRGRARHDASSDSRAPFGLPGRLTIRRPAADADDAPAEGGHRRGAAALGPHRLGDARAPRSRGPRGSPAA